MPAFAPQTTEASSTIDHTFSSVATLLNKDAPSTDAQRLALASEALDFRDAALTSSNQDIDRLEVWADAHLEKMAEAGRIDLPHAAGALYDKAHARFDANIIHFA